MFRDEDGKYTDVRFVVQDMGSDTCAIKDRGSELVLAAAWSDNREVIDRLADLLNRYGMDDPLIIDK